MKSAGDDKNERYEFSGFGQGALFGAELPAADRRTGEGGVSVGVSAAGALGGQFPAVAILRRGERCAQGGPAALLSPRVVRRSAALHRGVRRRVGVVEA